MTSTKVFLALSISALTSFGCVDVPLMTSAPIGNTDYWISATEDDLRHIRIEDGGYRFMLQFPREYLPSRPIERFVSASSGNTVLFLVHRKYKDTVLFRIRKPKEGWGSGASMEVVLTEEDIAEMFSGYTYYFMLDLLSVSTDGSRVVLYLRLNPTQTGQSNQYAALIDLIQKKGVILSADMLSTLPLQTPAQPSVEKK